MAVKRLTRADYDAQEKKLAAAEKKAAAYHAELVPLRGEVEALRGQVSSANALVQDLKGQLAEARAVTPPDAALAEAARVVEPKTLDTDPRWKYSAEAEPKGKMFKNAADEAAAREVNPDFWFDNADDALAAWRAQQFTPLPEDDGQTVAEATA